MAGPLHFSGLSTLGQGPQRDPTCNAPNGAIQAAKCATPNEGMAHAILASAEGAILQDAKARAYRPLQILLRAGQLPCGVAILQPGHQVYEEVAESQVPAQKRYLGEIEASA